MQHTWLVLASLAKYQLKMDSLCRAWVFQSFFYPLILILKMPGGIEQIPQRGLPKEFKL